MTNKEEIEDRCCENGVVDLLAVHLINQILDEASIIVSAAKDYDQPWNYISNLTKERYCRLDETYEEGLTFVVSKGDSQLKYESQENVVVTSTPQKTENKIVKLNQNEVDFMGQGDELEVRGYELRKSTSMFINNLFDMSDVDGVIYAVESGVMRNKNSRSEELLLDTKTTILKNSQLGLNTKQDSINSKSEEYSSYSFLDDALCTEITKDFDFLKYHDGENHMLSDIEWESKNSANKVMTCVVNQTTETMDNNDLAFYENAYITMNRDYEQYSEDGEPILQDPKAASMQEVDLITNMTSNDNVASCQVLAKKELKATSGVLSSGTGSRKSNVVRRFRNQGAKLLSCLKGWWWQKKVLGERKEPRVYGSIRGLCPLSPGARRRTSSLLDQRSLRSPTPSRSLAWKFNTVNEALVNSSRWKNLNFKTDLN